MHGPQVENIVYLYAEVHRFMLLLFRYNRMPTLLVSHVGVLVHNSQGVKEIMPICCQAQPQLQLNWAELALFSLSTLNLLILSRNSGKVNFSAVRARIFTKFELVTLEAKYFTTFNYSHHQTKPTYLVCYLFINFYMMDGQLCVIFKKMKTKYQITFVLSKSMC